MPMDSKGLAHAEKFANEFLSVEESKILNSHSSAIFKSFDSTDDVSKGLTSFLENDSNATDQVAKLSKYLPVSFDDPLVIPQPLNLK